MKATGTSSTSFRIWLATFVPGLASAVTAITQGGSTSHQAIFGLGGGVLSLVSTLGKLFHDHGLNKASLAAAGSDIAAQLPQLKADLSKSVSFVEQDLPGVRSVIDSVTSRVTALEAKVPDLAGIEATVRNVVQSIFTATQQAAPAPTPPLPPAA